MTGGMHAATSSRLRQKIQTLRAERNKLEEQLLEIRSLLRSPLIAHHTLSGGRRRSKPAYYLFRRDEGRKRLIYVRQADLERVRRLVETARRYRDGLRRLRLVGVEILAAFKLLRQSQEDRP